MTKVIKKWQLTNTDKDRSFETVEDFFNHSCSVEVDTAKLNGHIENDDTHCTGKLGFMSNDRKHVIVIREFSSADDYDIWSTKRKELGDIDNLIEEEEMKIESGEEYDFDVAQEA